MGLSSYWDLACTWLIFSLHMDPSCSLGLGFPIALNVYQAFR